MLKDNRVSNLKDTTMRLGVVGYIPGDP
ncbi:uncharacterized protein METZ01_LOCUS380818, partial [marine metagenome]